MRALVAFLLRYYHIALFILLEGAALALLFGSGTWHGYVWFTAASEITGRVHSWQSSVLAFFDMKHENAVLLQHNMVLTQRVELLRRQLDIATHDSTYGERLLAQQLDTLQLIPAMVVHNEVNRRDNYITIDRGEADGVHTEMGVASGKSIVGIVYLTGKHYSLVMPVLNSKSSISCRLRNTDCFGYLRWPKRGNTFFAVMDDVPRHARVKVGDVVETSGFSSVFPAGMFVGRVSRIHNSDDGLSYQLDVHLGTDFSRLHNVSVIVPRPHSDEIKTLRDSIKALP